VSTEDGSRRQVTEVIAHRVRAVGARRVAGQAVMERQEQETER
jgi:hypothetical protein